MNKKISLILGSGGARGLAHIGVIKELEKRGFEIGAVVGCSIGALVGGFYCAGKLDAYEEWVRQLSEWDTFKFLDISLTPKSGMMKGDLIIDTLKEMVGTQHIEDLPINYSAVATDIVARKEIWLNSGDLFDAIRASMAIPGIFTPKVVDGRSLVDGGVLNPLPIAPSMFEKNDLTVAVSLSGYDVTNPFGTIPLEERQTKLESYRYKIEGFLNNVQDRFGLESDNPAKPDPELRLTDILLGTFDAMQSSIARHRLASYPPDILIEIPGNICQTHEFYKARPLIAAGHYWTEHALAKYAERIV
jgi:NTE family protein